jgi:hypothetical protein
MKNTHIAMAPKADDFGLLLSREHSVLIAVTRCVLSNGPATPLGIARLIFYKKPEYRGIPVPGIGIEFVR